MLFSAATVHRQSGRDAAEQQSGDRGCDEKNPGEWPDLGRTPSNISLIFTSSAPSCWPHPIHHNLKCWMICFGPLLHSAESVYTRKLSLYIYYMYYYYNLSLSDLARFATIYLILKTARKKVWWEVRHLFHFPEVCIYYFCCFYSISVVLIWSPLLAMAETNALWNIGLCSSVLITGHESRSEFTCAHFGLCGTGTRLVGPSVSHVLHHSFPSFLWSSALECDFHPHPFCCVNPKFTAFFAPPSRLDLNQSDWQLGSSRLGSLM